MEKIKILENLKNETLEDVYNILCRNEPTKKTKIHNEWDYLESIAYEELLDENEHPNECQKIIDEIVTFLEKQWKRKKTNLISLFFLLLQNYQNKCILKPSNVLLTLLI